MPLPAGEAKLVAKLVRKLRKAANGKIYREAVGFKKSRNRESDVALFSGGQGIGNGLKA